MHLLVTTNGILLLLALFLAIYLLINLWNEPFIGISNVLLFLGILIPVVFSVVNVIMALGWYPQYLLLSLLPLLIPITILIAQQAMTFQGKREYQKFATYAQHLGKIARERGIQLQQEDVRIAVKPKKRVDYTFMIYKGDEMVIFKTIEKELENLATKEYPGYQIKINGNFNRFSRKSQV